MNVQFLLFNAFDLKNTEMPAPGLPLQGGSQGDRGQPRGLQARRQEQAVQVRQVRAALHAQGPPRLPPGQDAPEEAAKAEGGEEQQLGRDRDQEGGQAGRVQG